MPFTTIVFLQRKPDLTPEDFKDYYENHHMPLAQDLAGASFPTLHKRYYLVRSPDDSTSTDTAASTSTSASTDASTKTKPKNYIPHVLAGQPDDFPWDVCVEMTFEDMQHLADFRARLDAQAERVAEDERRFMDRKRVFVAEVEGPFVSARAAL
ncbi:hypothetical protein BO71DRAFT_401733 [Aspergillus ellipticus CBS 707.79]|uniref:EthD domain-containing protein n=1 Tax=Aspergillus ellipticus CBS 707.79 TaxID=1448320 RepID=A0A319D1X5_9EURO|nr:hypothetical protein BO71DRAFT_401733 [Aspergillus ellipticus CBS 707.79]